MDLSGFHFNDEQLIALRDCWKRPRDREIAAAYLQEVERLISMWADENSPHPPTSIKRQIELARKLQLNVENSPELLDQIPWDLEKLLATMWLRHQYGDEYFRRHEEACRKDHARNSARQIMLRSALRALAPDRAGRYPEPVSELSKLPPDYFQQSKSDPAFLRAVAEIAREISWMLKGSKSWLEAPDDERGLIYLLAFSYRDHFGKLPSAANQGRDGNLPPFRGILKILAEIITEQSHNLREYKFGAETTRDVLHWIKEAQKANLPSCNKSTG